MSEEITSALAQEIISKAQTHVAQLIGRNWPEISTILSDEQEVKLSFGTIVTNRDAESGTQADKDHRIKTTISFSKRFTDTTEAALEDPNQPSLLRDEHFTDSTDSVQGGEILREAVEQHRPPAMNTQKPEPRNLGSTPLGEALALAAAGKNVPIVPINISGDYTPDRARTQFRKAAKKAGWPEECIDLLDEALLEARDDMDAVLRILSAHTLTPAPKAA